MTRFIILVYLQFARMILTTILIRIIILVDQASFPHPSLKYFFVWLTPASVNRMTARMTVPSKLTALKF